MIYEVLIRTVFVHNHALQLLLLQGRLAHNVLLARRRQILRVLGQVTFLSLVGGRRDLTLRDRGVRRLRVRLHLLDDSAAQIALGLVGGLLLAALVRLLLEQTLHL